MSSQPLLKVEGLSRRFGGLLALNEVSFEVPAGTALGIIGPNGSGKSTLFENISGAQRPSGGRVWFKGQDVTSLQAHERCELGIARTFQLVETFGQMSVFENVLVAAMLRLQASDARDQTQQLLERLGLAQRSARPAGELSASELRRLDVARALATSPSLLLLDEPLAGLTDEEIARTLDTLRELGDGGLTIIMIEHRLEAMFGFVTHALALNAGRVLASGTAAEVQGNAAVIDAYLGTGAAEDA
jgi:branched-chain amino acid transport system ATP-binding protein